MLEKKFVHMYIIYEHMPYGRYIRRRRSATRRYARKKTTRRTTKTGYSRRKYFRPTRALRAKWVNPLSQKQMVRFVYADSSFSRTLNIANGFTSYYVFRGNSPYDPDYTGVGVQPYGFDQYFGANLCTNFVSRSSSIRVYFRPEEAYANMRRLHCFVIPIRVSNPVLTDVSDVRNIPNHKETVYDGSTETTRGARIKHYAKNKTAYSEVSNANEYSFGGSYSANPSLTWYWIILFYTDTYDDEEIDIYFDVKIKYYTVCSRGLVPDES